MARLWRVLVLGVACLAAACGPARPPANTPGTSQAPGAPQAAAEAAPAAVRSRTIGYAAPELSGGQGRIMNAFIAKAGAMGWRVLTANASSQPKIQESQIDYFLSRGVDAIVAIPVDSTAICSAISRARARGVPFYTIDRAPIGCAVDMVVMSDNRMGGVQSGEALVAILTRTYGAPRGTVLELQGDLAQNVGQLRGQGFHDVVDRYPGIHVISRETRWESERFASETEEVATSTSIDAIYLHSDAIGVPAVLPVLDRIGKKIPRGTPGHIAIVGIDGSPDALQAMRDGFVDQASSQPILDFPIIADWIERDFAHLPRNAGMVVREGALWSPATVKMEEVGPVLFLSTTSVTTANVDDPRLWGNQ